MEDIYIIISKYLLGTASPQEEMEIMEWRNADAGHEQEFQELCESWQIAHAGIHPVIPDKERVWEKIMSNLNLVKPVKMYTQRLLYRAVGIAAMLALALGFSLSLLVSEKEEVGLVSFIRGKGRGFGAILGRNGAFPKNSPAADDAQCQKEEAHGNAQRHEGE